MKNKSQKQSELEFKLLEQETNWIQVKFTSKNISRRSFHSSIIFNSRLFPFIRLYIYGGYDITNGIMSDFHFLQLQSKQNLYNFKKVIYTGQIPKPKHSAVSFLYNQQMFIHGGKISSFYNTDQLCKFNFKFKQWLIVETQGQKPPAIDSHVGTLYNQSLIIFAGYFGQPIGKFSNSIYKLCLKQLIWKCLYKGENQNVEQNKAPLPRTNSGISIINNRLYIFGGTNIDNKFKDMWSFNLETLEWTQIIYKSTSNYIPCVTLLQLVKKWSLYG